MPTYGYCCRACGHEFEEFQSILAAPTKVCPKCKKRQVQRQLSTGGAVIFKGGGFYETDYRSADYEKAQKADAKAAETKPDSKVESKPDSKPDSKSDTSTPGKTPAKSDTKTDEKSEMKTQSKTEVKPSASDSAKGSTKERTTSEESPRKSHAREGRGIGNILQSGRAKKPTKTPAKPIRKHR